MAETTGLVQQLNVLSGSIACAWIGPTASNTELLVVQNDGSAEDIAFAASLVQTLAAAATNFRAVVAFHADSDAVISSLRIDPV